MAKQVRPRKREPGSHLSFEDESQIRTFPADSLGASRLIILHQRPDIRQQPDLNCQTSKSSCTHGGIHISDSHGSATGGRKKVERVPLLWWQAA
jgi:hypothetical protein